MEDCENVAYPRSSEGSGCWKKCAKGRHLSCSGTCRNVESILSQNVRVGTPLRGQGGDCASLHWGRRGGMRKMHDSPFRGSNLATLRGKCTRGSGNVCLSGNGVGGHVAFRWTSRVHAPGGHLAAPLGPWHCGAQSCGNLSFYNIAHPLAPGSNGRCWALSTVTSGQSDQR